MIQKERMFMKKKIAVAVAAAVLCAVFAVMVFASSSQQVPSLFHNDEAWYKDEMAPALYRNGAYYVPIDFVAMFDYISFTTHRDGENILLTNSETGDYLSVLCSHGSACANGTILENIGVFRENGYYYLEAEIIAAYLGVAVEYSHKDTPKECSVRVYDEHRLMQFDELLALYEDGIPAETEGPGDLFPVETEEEPTTVGERTVRIFLLCCESEGDEIISSGQVAEQLGFTYSLFLTPGAEGIWELDMNSSVGLYAVSADEAESMNETLERLYCRKTHTVLATGNDTEDRKLMKAGYYLLKPDFTVGNTTDADVVLGKIEEYAQTHDYITVFLGNVWQSETLLMKLAELDGVKYDIGGIPGFN